MTNYGFVIDNRNCIGCHACSVACKEENEVPLGVYRTWVKYVETGTFPDSRRHFQVTRCNHCANPPCVRICPVTAMYQRSDGIVEFDPQVCIGCKACLQACPYDAIYIDPDTHSAAKCHYCSHRTEIGLEPACVIVCPTHAIISGDLDDPHSEISQLVSRHPVTVRKPEQGTAPKLFYIEGDAVAMTPTAASLNNTMMWADVKSDQAQTMSGGHGNSGFISLASIGSAPKPPAPAYAASGTPIRIPQTQTMGVGKSSLMLGGRQAGQMVQTAYNAQHKIPWHWQVPAYLVTKGIASGLFIYLALEVFFDFGFSDIGYISDYFFPVSLFLSLLFTGITTLLLVLDLEKPKMFLTILTRPQWRSWLTRGAFVLIGFSILTGLWFMMEMLPLLGIVPDYMNSLDPSYDIRLQTRPYFALIGVPLAVLTAIYTAFLFAQAEGRDLWQSPLLPFHFLIQAIIAGTAALVLVQPWLPPSSGINILIPPSIYPTDFLLWGLVIDLFIILVGEFAIPHASEVAARAAHNIKYGKYAGWFWGGAIAIGHVVPLALLLIFGMNGIGVVVAAIAALVGLYAYEYAFVMAPQEIPNS